MALQGWTKALLLLPFWISLSFSADFTVSECFDTEEPATQGAITLTCPENHVISVDDAVFGSNYWGACIITEDDCTEQTKIFQVCDGQVNCTRTFKTFTTTCGFSTMLVLGYSCVRSYKDHSTIATIDTTEEIAVSSRSSVFPKSNPKIPRNQDSESDSKNNEDIGLIIGCAVASFITVVFLIIAIVMVIRRLLQSDEKDRQGNGPGTTVDCGSICIKLDCLPCIGRAETPRQNSHDLRMRKKATIETGPQSDQSKLRVAPIGEESIIEQGSALSEDQDSKSSGSSKYAEEAPSLQGHHGKSNPEKPPRQKDRPTQQETFVHENLKRGSFKEPTSDHGVSSSKDHENDNTLPSSSNRNLQPLQDPMDINHTQIKQTTRTPQQTFDAVAIPNTMSRSTC